MEPLPVPVGLENRIDELWERARKRWLITMAVVAVLGPIAGLVAARITDGSRKPRSTHHHHSAGGWIVVLVVLLVEAALLFVLVRYIRRRFKAQWVPLSAGLPWRERRALTRRIRRGEPSADQFHRYVETFTARKIALQRRRSQLAIPAFTITAAAIVALNWGRNSFLTCMYLALLAVLVIGLPRTIQTWRGADRYLRTVNIDPDLLRRSG